MNKTGGVLIVVALLSAGCSEPDAGPALKAAAPATVEHARTEAELSTVTLSPEAIKRLGIESVAASVQQVSGSRTLGGEVMVPEGRTVLVSAPVAGTLVSAGAITAGARVRKGAAVFRLLPLAAGERDERIDVQRSAAQAEAEEQAARQRLTRLEQLLQDGAASVRAVEEARAQHAVTSATLVAARERVQGLDRSAIGTQGELTIAAPFDGILQSVAAASGQTVAASTPLFAVAQVDTLWVRVPIYAGEMGDIATAQPAVLTSLGASDAPRTLRQVAAPPRGNPNAASVDLFYEIGGEGAPVQPGQRVSVQIPLASSTRGLVIPDAAVLYDMHGATWVYEEQENGRYVRRRIEVARQVGDRVLVSRGLSEGTRVVRVGAAELFGTEFGTGK